MHINIVLFGILQTPPFVNHNGKDVNSDWLADQSDERSVLGHALNDKGKMKDDDHFIFSTLHRLQKS